MHGVKSVAAAALLGLASAAPTPQQASSAPSGGSFKVTNQPTGNMSSRDGTMAYHAAMTKHNMALPEDFVAPSAQNKAASSSSSKQTGDVTANSVNNDVEYTSPISIGGQNITMDFDTGSSDLWVFNSLMSSQMASGHTQYNPSKSSTFKQMQGQQFSVSYGDGSYAQGNTVGTDTVNIGGAQVSNQVIELPSQVGPSFIQDTKSNGLVGLAFSKLNTVKPNQANTFFENVQGQLQQPVFTANLRHDAPGAYEFGTIDNSSFQGNMQWVNIDQESGFWQFPSSNFQVGNKGQVLQNTNASPGIADTGTSLILVDPPVAETYYSAVQGAANVQGQYVFPNNAVLPDFSFSAGTGNQMVTVPANFLNYTAFNQTHTFGGLQSNNGQGTQIFGDVMFKAQFVAFDIGNARVGFAPHSSS